MFPVQMRASPTVTHLTNYTVFFAGVNAFTASAIASSVSSNAKGFHLDTVTLNAAPGNGLCGVTYVGESLGFSAEL
jgi:hypothetical protein